MARFCEKLWNWGHLEGSHNEYANVNCSMTPEQFAEEYGIKKAFIVSYGGNIQPPFENLAKRFSVLDEVKWSVLGDGSTPLPEHELGNTPDVIEAANAAENITGGVVDDFFSPTRLERFTPEILGKMKKSLNDKGLDFWCVLYRQELETIEKYLDCFDGVTFWIWKCAEIELLDETLERLFAATKGKPVMLGIYLYDYDLKKPMDTALFTRQLEAYIDLVKSGKIEGIIFCSSTVGDADLETNRILKRVIAEQGNTEI